MIEIISNHKSTNADRIRSLNDEELARENVVGFTYICGYTPSIVWRSVHAGEFDTKEEAVEAELKWLQQPAE
ncbi:MAG: hypothetical protein ACLRPH_00700 [Ruminococcus sp.]